AMKLFLITDAGFGKHRSGIRQPELYSDKFSRRYFRSQNRAKAAFPYIDRASRDRVGYSRPKYRDTQGDCDFSARCDPAHHRLTPRETLPICDRDCAHCAAFSSRSTRRPASWPDATKVARLEGY